MVEAQKRTVRVHEERAHTVDTITQSSNTYAHAHTHTRIAEPQNRVHMYKKNEKNIPNWVRSGRGREGGAMVIAFATANKHSVATAY